jgi:dTDP-4-amino-4,6-dideoxygalactose transaminase
MFYIICKDQVQREVLIVHLQKANINAVFHYLSLHKSLFYSGKHDWRKLPMSDRYSERLLRLPFFTN